MTALRIDDSLVRWSVEPERVDDALGEQPLLVLLHGYGSFEGDLISLAPHLPARFVCASPRAPLTAPPPVVNGYAWFPLGEPGTPDPRAVDEAAGAVLDWIDRLASRATGALGPIALLGFSQGGAMVTQLFRRRPEAFAAGVNLSGFAPGGSFPGDAALAASRPPMFWGRDTADPIIAPVAIERTSAWLPEHFTVEARLYPGIAHSVSGPELADVAGFLTDTVLAR